MANINNYLMTVFTSQTGEAFTILQLLHQIADKIGGEASSDVAELAKTVEAIEKTVAQHTTKLQELTARLAQAEQDIDILQEAIVGVESTLNLLNGEIV